MSLAKYLGARLSYAAIVLIVVTFVAFIMIRLVPGDPARKAVGPYASQESVDALRHELGLDQPLLSQAFVFMKDAARFDFGSSITQNATVASLVGPRIVPSLALAGAGLAIALVIATSLALAAARRRDTWIDHAIRGVSSVMLAMPSFWFGLILALVFGYKLGLLPTSGYGYTFGEHVQGLVLPAVTLGVAVAPLMLRTLRSSLLDTFGQDYIEAARARGLSNRRVVWRHALRNSLAATVTVLGVIVGYAVSGAVVIESVFAIPGLGSLLVSSVATRDFPVIQALVVLFGALVVAVSILNDLLYAALDPRVRL